MTPTVTIIVPCRNEARHIGPFLDCLAAQDFGGLAWEAIIADARSTDGTRETLTRFEDRYPGQVRIIDNPARIVSTGLNLAIRAAAGEIILRMDIHTEYARDYVARCVEALESTGAWNVGGPARTLAHGYMARAIAAAYHSPFACGGARFHDMSYEGYVDTVTYGCWRKETLEAVGMFDESLVRNQDDELNLRITRAGGRVWQTPRIVSWYSPRPRLRLLFKQYFQYGFWKVAVIRKHRIPASWRHLVPIAFIAANLILGLAAILETAIARSFWAAALWAVMLGCYSACSIAAALLIADRDVAPVLPVVFATYHLSYGLGFLCGLLYWKSRSTDAVAPAAVFTEISR